MVMVPESTWVLFVGITIDLEVELRFSFLILDLENRRVEIFICLLEGVEVAFFRKREHSQSEFLLSWVVDMPGKGVSVKGRSHFCTMDVSGDGPSVVRNPHFLTTSFGMDGGVFKSHGLSGLAGQRAVVVMRFEGRIHTGACSLRSLELSLGIEVVDPDDIDAAPGLDVEHGARGATVD